LAELAEGGAAEAGDAMTAREGRDKPRVRPIDAESQEEVRLFAEEIIAAADELSTAGGAASDGADQRIAQIRRYAEFLRDRMSRGAPVQLLDVLREIRSSAVRYAARQGKRVRVVAGGQGALVSSTVGDTLLEAVMHLVRNSVDHGITTLDERARAGRHPAATIKIRVDGNGKGVRVVVQDDGVGIDESAVRARADDATGPLLDILARPGFSMRDAADATSGRGVGLDNVVHSVRTLLGGEIKMINKPESGLTFVISVPAAARLIHVLLVESGDLAYAVPTATVVTRAPLERRRMRRDSFGTLYYEHEGEILALTTITGRAPQPRAISESAVGIVTRAGGKMRVLVADAVLGEEAVVREDARVKRVYSRSLGRDIGFVFPAALGPGQG
ncbi:MAG: ATP-binding protein, partial [Spirochaetota bacterium]